MLENQYSLKPWKSVAPTRTKILQALTFYCSYLALSTWFNLQVSYNKTVVVILLNKYLLQMIEIKLYYAKN